jgi:CRISP-associated protein Cas1
MHALAVTEQGTRVRLEGEQLAITRGDDVLQRVRLAGVRELLLFGEVEVTTAALAALARRGIDLVYLSPWGYFRARLVGPHSAQAALRLAQYRRCQEESFAAAVAAAMVGGKIAHQRQVLLRAQRRLRDEAVAVALGRLRLLGEECARCANLERLRGLEGQAAALYFAHFGKLLLRPEMVFSGRSRRPPRDPVNACLSFGYTLLTNVVATEVLRCGLDPMLGLFHQPLHNRPSLALDLVEEFRPFVDALVLRLVNRGQLSPDDFEGQRIDLEAVLAGNAGADGSAGETTGQISGEAEPETLGVFLNHTGRKVFLREFFRRLRERLYYPPRQGAWELRDIVREQAYHLARVLLGEEEAYRPFVPA